MLLKTLADEIFAWDSRLNLKNSACGRTGRRKNDDMSITQAMALSAGSLNVVEKPCGRNYEWIRKNSIRVQLSGVCSKVSLTTGSHLGLMSRAGSQLLLLEPRNQAAYKVCPSPCHSEPPLVILIALDE
jgi:hypothetical protein